MSAAVGGYETIQDATSSPLSIKQEQVSGNPTATAHYGPGGGGAARMQAVAARAGAAAQGARDALNQLVAAPMPEVNLYTEPLNPGAQLTLNDRVQLVLESCRPWGEFFDVRSFNLPAAAEAKLRVGHNVEVFFYNYLVLAMGLLTLTAFVHPLRALLVSLAVFAAVALYVVFPEDYYVSDSVVITQPVKHVIVATVCILTLLFGHVLALLFFFASLCVPMVLLHALLREHSAVGAIA